MVGRMVREGDRVRIGDGGAFRGATGTVVWVGRFGPMAERRAQIRLDATGAAVMVAARRAVPATAAAERMAA